MHSGEHPATLARRLAITLAVAAIAAAALAIAAAMLLADAIIAARVESSVAAAARVMRVEIDEAPDVAHHVEAEARTLGIDGRVEMLPAGGVEGCRVVSEGETPELICAESLRSRPGALVLVAVPVERMHGHRIAFVVAAAAVLLLVTVTASAVGTLLARRSLLPLHRLRHAVIDIDAAAPAAVDLPPPTGLEEIDALRGALANLIERLHDELSRARRFAASAAHELRTPLATMRAEIELAIESRPEPQAVDATFLRLSRTTRRLETLAERLLVLATPQEALATEQGASMAQLVEDLVPRRFLGEATRLRLEICEADALVRGDEHLLASMVDNVVDNALKFSDGPVSIIVSEQRDNVVIDVDDAGPGVPEELERELFEPFRRGPHDKRQPGHGLGLALAAHIARAYGGRVAFVRKPDVGARVRILLPLHRGVAEDETSTAPT